VDASAADVSPFGRVLTHGTGSTARWLAHKKKAATSD